MLRKVISILLVFVVVFTTSGFTISSHICKGKKVETVVGMFPAEWKKLKKRRTVQMRTTLTLIVVKMSFKLF